MAKENLNELVVGAWHNGLHYLTKGDVEAVELKVRKGFGLYGPEKLAADLIALLDSYDTLVEELLLSSPAAVPVDEDEKWEDFLLDQEDFHEYEMQVAEDIPEIEEFFDPQPPEPIKAPRVGKAKSRIKKV